MCRYTSNPGPCSPFRTQRSGQSQVGLCPVHAALGILFFSLFAARAGEASASGARVSGMSGRWSKDIGFDVKRHARDKWFDATTMSTGPLLRSNGACHDTP